MSVVVGTDSYIDQNDLKKFDKDFSTVINDTDLIDDALTSAYGEVNSVLRQEVPIPLKKNRDDDYDEKVKNWQAALALHFIYAGTSTAKSREFLELVRNENDTGYEDQFFKHCWLLDEQKSSAEIGIQEAVPNNNNSGTGKCYANITDQYTGDRRETITIEITTAGASETAVYKHRSNHESSWNTSVTTDTTFQSVGIANASIYFPDKNDSNAYKVGDQWTVECIPEFHKTANRKKVKTVGVIRA